jgi:hypothetical protein
MPIPPRLAVTNRGDGDVGLPVDVRVEELAVVHAVQVIARQNEVIVGIVAHEVPRRLSHGVGRALEPVRVVGRLLGGQDVHEAAREQVHPVRLGDVPVERGRVELRQHEDPADVGVEAVADRDIDQAVFAADRNRRLGTVLREREEPRALPASKNDGQNLVVRRHDPDMVHRPRLYGPGGPAQDVRIV